MSDEAELDGIHQGSNKEQDLKKRGSDSLQPVRSSEYRVPKDRRTPECSEAAHDAFVSLNAFIVAGNLIVIAAKIHHSTGPSQAEKGK